MSDNDSSMKGPGGKVAAWTDREVLVYLFSAMEYSKFTPDYTKAPLPVGRNASGTSQKMTKLKNALRPEIDALKASQPLAVATDGTTKKGAGGRKRKAADDGSGGDGAEKKRERKKKTDIEREAELSDEGADFEMKIKFEAGDIDGEV